MYMTIGIIILGLFAAVKTRDSKIIRPATTKPEDSITIDIFQGDEKNPLQFPMGLTQIEIKSGRLTSGTEFYTIPPKKQLFFCPFRSYDTSLMGQFETEFEKSQALQCEDEPKPIIYPTTEEDERCGKRGDGVLMGFLYKIFTGDVTEDFQIHSFNTYTFCYDKSRKKVLYIEYKTVSANLLSEPFLKSEREIKFEGFAQLDSYGQIDQDYYKKLEDQAKLLSNYGFQKLLPSEFMPFYSWRKSTYHQANISLQPIHLMSLWNEMQSLIIIDSTETHQLPRTIMTGVHDIPTIHLPFFEKKGEEIRNIWITLVMDTNVETNYKGLAVMMHNFSKKIFDTPGSTSNGRKQYIDMICGEDLCVGSLRQKINAVPGDVRCCRVNENIKKLFFYKREDLDAIDQILEIRGITYDA